MVDNGTVFALADGISYQALGPGGGAVVLTIGSGQLYTCNDTTAAFLGAVDGRRTFAELIDHLHQRFEVPRDDLQHDVAELAKDLVAEGILWKH